MKSSVFGIRLLLVLALVLSGGACRRDPKAGAGNAPQAGAASEVRLSTWPSPPVALRTTNFLVRLPGSMEGGPSGRKVAVDLTMPDMYHGENRPPCTEVDPGEYLCKGYLVMGGRWRVAVEVDGTEAATFFLDAVEGKAD